MRINLADAGAAACAWREGGYPRHGFIGFAVADFPKFEYSNRDVMRVGDALRGTLPDTHDTVEIFRIANSWRQAHAYPMHSVRRQLIWYMGHLGIEGITGARLKRMPAIRRKLSRIGLGLNQLQDIAGCRAVLPKIGDVYALVAALRDRSRHDLRDEDPYISKPKRDGYRSYHMMFNYRGRGAAKVFDDRRVEIQIRTRLQHSWATAVEAVGLFRNEDLKGNKGNPDWLRLFKLMSAEFAVAEGCPEPPDVPDHPARVTEIQSLNGRLDATDNLNNLSNAVRWTDIAIDPNFIPSYYVIAYDNATHEVAVRPYSGPRSAVAAYNNAEALDSDDSTTIVLVEAAKIEAMKEAYPNYFGDVQLFRMQLNNIVKGRPAKEYVVKPQETVMPRPKENPDFMWLKRRKRIRWQ
jgi:ppGpp synthetase/RelA/SpoT-type nucleotidyltranferase